MCWQTTQRRAGEPSEQTRAKVAGIISRAMAAANAPSESARMRYVVELLHDWNAPGGGQFGHDATLDALMECSISEEGVFWYRLACEVLGVEARVASVDPEERSNRAELEAARARVERAENDTRRLDWLDATSACIESIGQPLEYHTGISWREGESMRQAIDAALAKGEQG